MSKSRRREIIKERHKQEIIESALYLFGKKGYKDTTIEEIAEYAQFSKGSIYSYFSSKKQLFDEILKALFDKIQLFADEAKSLKGEAREKLRAYALNLVNFFLNENRYSFHVMMQAIMQMEADEKESTTNYVRERLRQISKILLEIIKADIKNRRLKNINPNLVVMAFNGMLRDIIYGCLTEDQIGMKPEEMVDMVIEIIFDGISKNK
ncbi:TetR/AcrR family transcriptional regulator [Candidatus Kryptobacter tengchongensis]|uniref:Transcriptional regulator, TetR family n=1 Tax=Kryptobacter tengchongensis TaxID=1643429 RepID=A0A656D7R3_KRYT1|nr:TetR/AcrR family transcriptional regulator [Candidatus Kryptobacter tengchongensis]CUT00764.1 transcriptional regulator, TetR family [Candidatus Kryptobacter tengchongensis]CUT05103.1 transcriptional regulator, TetR family [Candidatus Kryptobacter tengchongensis]